MFCSNCHKNLFYMSSKGNIRSSDELLEKSKKIVTASLFHCIEPNKKVHYSHPVFITSLKLNEQKGKKWQREKKWYTTRPCYKYEKKSGLITSQRITSQR